MRVNNRKKIIIGLQFALLVLCLLWLYRTGSAAQPTMTMFRGLTMGTSYSVKVAEDLEDDKILVLRKGIAEVLEGVNKQMSTYIKSSEISRFNRYQGKDWFAVSADFAAVVAHARRLSDETAGAFDVTVGALVNLWGFGPPPHQRKVPTDEEIRRAKQQTGYQRVEIRRDPPALKKDTPSVYLDLSAIAKGFAVDKVAEYLHKQGMAKYMVEIGGEIRTRGRKTEETTWQIGIEAPGIQRIIKKIISLTDRAMATSGDYRNYFEEKGIRFSHTIDPRTGKPIRHSLASITVIAQTCMEADAIATAIMVLGPQAGYQLAIDKQLPCFFIIRNHNGFEEKMTPQFKPLLAINN